MNVNLIRLKGVIQELRGIRSALDRLADCWELELAQSGLYVRPPKADQSGPPPDLLYTDDEDNAIKELEEAINRSEGRPPRQDEE